MTFLVMIFILPLCALLQSQFPAFAALGSVRFPFMAAAVVYYALNHESEAAVAAGLIGGFLIDALGPMPMGYSSLCMCLAAWIIGRFRHVVIVDALVTLVFFGGLTACLVTLGQYALAVGRGLPRVGGGMLILKALGNCLLGAAVTPFVFFAVRRADAFVGNVRVKESRDVFE